VSNSKFDLWSLVFRNAENEGSKGAGGEPTPAVTRSAPEPMAEPAPTGASWMPGRIATLTAKLHQAKAQLEALKPKPEGTQALQLTEADVESRAAQIADSMAFNDECNREAKKGIAEFGDAFKTRIANLASLVDPDDRYRYNTFLRAALDTEAGAKVLYTLGGNIEEATRIISLSPTKMAVELAKIAMQETKPISSAPTPIKPLASRNAAASTIEPDDPQRGEKLDTATWMKQREAQVKAQREARGRR
jgi:hypothetical protein